MGRENISTEYGELLIDLFIPGRRKQSESWID
jgi:hypothetical protein